MSTNNNNNNNNINGYVDEGKTHVQRAFMCQLRQAVPTDKELTTLNDATVYHTLLQSYYVWRKSCLLVSTPFLCIGMILGFVDLGTLKDASSYLNGFGKLLQILSNIDTAILFAAIVYAAMKWNHFQLSLMAVSIGWLVTFCIPLVQAFFPLEMIVQDDVLDLFDNSTIVSLKIQLALGYALALLPVVITFPGGAVRAAVRIRWLLQHSSLAGWILVLCAPFYSIVLCVSLVLVMQLAGNGVLLVGMLLIVCAPWLYVIKAKLFVGVWDDLAKEQVQRFQRIIGITTLTGFLLVIIWMFTAEVSGVHIVGSDNEDDGYTGETNMYLLTYGQALRMIIETVGRLLVTTVLFCDGILRMSVTNWMDDIERINIVGSDEVNDGFGDFCNAYGIVKNDPSSEQAVQSLNKKNANTENVCDGTTTDETQVKVDNDPNDATHDYCDIEVDIENTRPSTSTKPNIVPTAPMDDNFDDDTLHKFLKENLAENKDH